MNPRGQIIDRKLFKEDVFWLDYEKAERKSSCGYVSYKQYVGKKNCSETSLFKSKGKVLFSQKQSKKIQGINTIDHEFFMVQERSYFLAGEIKARYDWKTLWKRISKRSYFEFEERNKHLSQTQRKKELRKMWESKIFRYSSHRHKQAEQRITKFKGFVQVLPYVHSFGVAPC